ncbi:MAG: glycerol acyltransferase [Microbacteriaceae bacterium]|nr:glycerol acyltransferase [Microbacteriaceae bacterium]
MSPKARREPIYTTAVDLGRTVLWALRLKRSVTGEGNLPEQGGAVLAMTHFGYLEFALVAWMMWLHNKRRIRFMIVKRAFDTAGIGYFLRGMHHIPVDMTNGGSGKGGSAYAAAVETLRSGELLGVFPEAGVSSSFTVRELKSGAVRLAAEAGVPLIPIAVWGGQRLLTKGRKIPFFSRFGVPVSFAVGTPIIVSPTEDVKEVTKKLQQTLQTLVTQLQETYPDAGSGQWWQPASLGGTAPTPEIAAAEEAKRQKHRDERDAREAAEEAGSS